MGNRFSTNTKVLQRIDALAVPMVCALLTLWRKVSDLFLSRDTDREPRRVLFLKLAEQGSTVLAYEAVKRAVDRVGKEHVYFLLFEENRFILDALNLVPHDNVLAIRTKSPLTMMLGALQRLWQIRRIGIDTVIDMEFFARSSAVISYLTGARVRVGFHAWFGEGPYRGNLFTHRVMYNAHLHTSRLFVSLVEALNNPPEKFPAYGFSPPENPGLPQFSPSAAERDEALRIVSELVGNQPRRLILLNANASDLLPLRRWESANYVELAKQLLAKFPDISIAFTGAPDEALKVTELVKLIGSDRVFCLAGKTTLRQLLIIYGLAEILVTNDSGPAHFAALTPIDTVVLFGPETPLLFGALTPRNHNLWARTSCSPCVNAWNNRQTACRDNICMQLISVNQVFETVCQVYQNRIRQ
ncbi:MAG: glycosyltransferase family 9 protein [Verrucomicrobiales bacterium]|jgi:ADP-heptose:LPS heptosyltransferase|nr:glycosyltransferase family 9 protein [Verrucomicrobiales bacterium]